MRKWVENAVFGPRERSESAQWLRERSLEPVWIPVDGLLEEAADGKVNIEVFSMTAENKLIWDEVPGDKPRPRIVWVSVPGPMPPEHLTEESK